MRILSIDTSTSTGGIALLDDEKGLLGNYQLNLANSHSSRLFIAIENLLKDTKLTMQNMQVIAITLGPGSFTGLRIGLMAAKTFSHLGNIKLMGISTLESLAYPLRYTDGIICPILDALKGDIYCAIFQNQKGNWNSLLPDSVMPLEKYLNELDQYDQSLSFIFMGNAVEKYHPEIHSKFSNRVIIPSETFQIISPAVIAELALDKIKSGNAKYLDPLSVQPNHISI